MFCKNCGAKLKENSKFCEYCGSSVESNSQNQIKEVQNVSGNENQTVNLKPLKILAYLGIFIIIGLLSNHKDDKSLKFHLGQGMLVLVLNVVLTILQYIQISMFMDFIFSILSVFTFVLSIIGIVNVCQDKDKELPIIGKFAFYK